MELKKFEEIIDIIRKQDDVIQELYDRKIDLIDFVDIYHKLISILFKEYYGTDGEDWITWFLYEKTTSGTLEAWDTIDGEKIPICYDVKSLWEYVEKLKTNKNEK